MNLTGIYFGTIEPDGTGTTFAQWAQTVTCSGFGRISGAACVKIAIQNATYLAASQAVTANYANYASVVLMTKNNAISGTGGNPNYYALADYGQGPSCGSAAIPDTTPQWTPSTDNCSTGTDSMQQNGGLSNQWQFPTRGLKITCKNVCGAQSALNLVNWDGVIGKAL